MREGVEHYSQVRALQAAERSDVAIVVADATEADRGRPGGGRPGGPRTSRHAPRDEQVGPRPARPRPHPGLRAKSRQRPPSRSPPR